MSTSFRHEIHQDLLVVTFCSPRTGNSLGLEDARALHQIIRQEPRRRGLIVQSGHPRLFCAGGRLSDYASLKKKSEGLRINREISKHLDALARWPGIKLALVNGDCFGGGLEWLASFDFRWGASDALFGFWQRRIGLTTGWGGGARWARRLPEDRVRTLLLSSHVFTAGQALRIGLIDRMVRRENILQEGIQWLRAVCEAGPTVPTDWSIRKEQTLFKKLWWSEPHRHVLKRWKK